MRKVLLILESGDLCCSIKQALSSKYEVELCDSSGARAQMSTALPDALILDLFLPGADGISLLRSLVDLRPPVIILLTSLCTDRICLEASRCGVTDLILKPFSLRHLNTILEKHLDK